MKKMSSLSLLETLNETLLLTKELIQKESMSQSQKAEILKKIVSKIKAICLLANTPVFSSRLFHRIFKPIKLLRMSVLTSSFVSTEQFKYYMEESKRTEYGERGILLYNGLEPELPCLGAAEKKSAYEIWLLRTGRFLYLKTTHYEVKGKIAVFEDYEQSEYAYVWRGEARETADPPELNRDEMIEVTSRFTYAISQILSTLKKVDESQQELLLGILGNLSWHESYFYTEFLNGGITDGDINWEKSIQPVIDKFVRHLPPKTISGLSQAAITHFLEICAHHSTFIDSYYPMEYIEELGKNVVEPLVKGLKNRDRRVRKVAAVWLGVIGDKEASKPLIEALKDEDEHVLSAAACALGKIGDEKAIEPLRQALERYSYYWLRQDIADAIGKIDQTAIEPYVVMFKEATEIDDRDKVEKAITGLEKIGNEKAVDLLIQYFFNEKVHPHYKNLSMFTRIDLARSLGRIGTEKAIEALIYVYKKEKKKNIWGVKKKVGKVLDQLGKRPKSLLEKLFRR